MTGFKAYFIHHLKKDLRPFLCIFAAVIALTLVISLQAQPNKAYDRATDSVYVESYNATLYLPCTILSLLAYVFPAMEFSFFKKRTHLDCAYALPVSRRALGTAHYLAGAIGLAGAFTLSYLTTLLVMLSWGPGNFSYLPVLAHYPLSLLLGLGTYSILTFAFNQANTQGDGIWFMLLYPLAYSLTVSALVDHFSLWFIPRYAMAQNLRDALTVYFQGLTENKIAPFNPFVQDGFLLWLILWIAIGLGAAAAVVFGFGKRRTEKTQELSDSPLGFPVLIPLCAASAMILAQSYQFPVIWMLIELIALIGYTVYRRGPRYKKSDLAVLLALSLFLIRF